MRGIRIILIDVPAFLSGAQHARGNFLQGWRYQKLSGRAIPPRVAIAELAIDHIENDLKIFAHDSPRVAKGVAYASGWKTAPRLRPEFFPQL